jgi:hypothetical protein
MGVLQWAGSTLAKSSFDHVCTRSSNETSPLNAGVIANGSAPVVQEYIGHIVLWPSLYVHAALVRLSL